ncbi:unnamed protein product [Symbiodinium sp. CCMP2592]|nr:unnamed protein product [Symbiodinium sp. CCMP2592]
MADQSKVLETMASQLTAVTAGLEALRVQGAAQTAANAETADKLAEMQQRISQHDLLTGDGPSVLSAAAPVARPQDWEIRIPQGDAGSSQPVSREECAAMITEALRINSLEHEVLNENNVGYLEWDLTTTTMEGTGGKKLLAPISILTVQTYAARKKVMDACSLAVVRYWREVKDEAGHEMDQGDDEKKQEADAKTDAATDSKDTPGSASSIPKTTETDATAQPSQKVWEIKAGNWNSPIKMAPGITQFEPRLGAPLHGLIFARFKKESLEPQAQLQTGSASKVQLPAEHKDKVLKYWRDVWYDQLKQQISRTKVEKEAFSSASQKTSQDYVAAAAARLNRFLTKDHPDRQFLQDLRPVDQLMEEMSADQAMETEVAVKPRPPLPYRTPKEGSTPAPEPSNEPDFAKEPHHPFDSQEEVDQEVENEKSSHKNRGFDVSGYSPSQWQDWVNGKKLRNLL